MNRVIIALLLLLAPVAKAAQQPVWVSAVESGLLSQPGWYIYNLSFFRNIEAWHQFSDAEAWGTSISHTVSLNSVIAPGTYNLWIAIVQLGATNGSIGITNIGDGSRLDWIGSSPVYTAPSGGTSYNLTNMGSFTSTVTFSNLTMKVYKMVGLGTAQNYWFGAIGIVPAAYGQLTDGSQTFLADYTAITATNTDYKAGNLIPNGDFEHDLNYGWTFSRNPIASVGYLATTNSTWINQGIDHTTASHGSNSVQIGEQQAYFRVFSPVIYPRGGTVGNYTLSYAYKGSGSLPSLKVEFGALVEDGALFAGTSGFFTNRLSILLTNFPSTSWQRASTNFYFTPLPTQRFYVDFYAGSVMGSTNVWIDEIQLVEGTSTNFLANNPLSIGVTANRNGNIFNTNEARTLITQFYNNTGTSAPVIWHYESYDWLNRLNAQSVQSATIPTGFSTTNFTLTTTNNGTSRVLAWMEQSDFRDELVFTVVELPAAPVLQTNSIFGIHGNYQRSIADSNKLWGFASFTRSLSPGFIARWRNIEPTSNTFVWTETDFQINAVTNKQIIFLSLSEGMGNFPSWCFTNGYPQLNAYSNYIWQVVNRYKDRVHFVETQNEPNAGGIVTAEQYAPMLTAEVTAAKAADPTCYFVAYALGVVDDAFVKGTWNLLTAPTKALIDAISSHNYPDSDLNPDENDNFGEAEAELAMTWGAYTGKPVWQTESGYWNIGVRKGDAIGGSAFANAVFSSDGEFPFRQGTTLAPEVAMRNLIRNLGVGEGRYFYYDSRQSDSILRTAVGQPSLWHIGYDALTASGAAFMWAKRFLDTPTNGVFNLTNATVRGFLFCRAAENVMAVFSVAKTNTDMTLTNGNFERLDMHGNRLGTNELVVRSGRFPTYWRSGTLTSNQMINIFNSASLSIGSDTTPPAVSVDVSAIGDVNARMLPLRFRWTAIDDFYFNTKDDNTAVVTRYRFLGQTDWSAWTADRTTTLVAIPGAASRIEVQARDRAGNLSEIALGPTFGVGALPGIVRGPTLARPLNFKVSR